MSRPGQIKVGYQTALKEKVYWKTNCDHKNIISAVIIIDNFSSNERIGKNNRDMTWEEVCGNLSTLFFGGHEEIYTQHSYGTLDDQAK